MSTLAYLLAVSLQVGCVCVCVCVEGSVRVVRRANRFFRIHCLWCVCVAGTEEGIGRDLLVNPV